MKQSRILAILSVVTASLAAAVFPVSAQSLRGSHASVNVMYRSALRGGLDFYETTAQIRRAVVRGELVPLAGNGNYVVSNVRTPYVRPETRSFVLDFASDYRRACDEPMVITSATRPMSRKLANSSSMSVHPTGMAVDLRRPSGRCLTWLRRSLLAAERRGVVEATEERRPPHFHVAVLAARYEHTATTRPPTTNRRASGR